MPIIIISYIFHAIFSRTFISFQMGQPFHLPRGGLVQARPDDGGDHTDGAVPCTDAPHHGRCGHGQGRYLQEKTEGNDRSLQRWIWRVENIMREYNMIICVVLQELRS